jgi:hypothetical protein
MMGVSAIPPTRLEITAMDTNTTTSRPPRGQLRTDLLRAIEDTLDFIDQKDYKNEARASMRYARLNMLRAMVKAKTPVAHSKTRYAGVLLNQAVMIHQAANEACTSQCYIDRHIRKLSLDHYMATVEYVRETAGD